MISLSLAYPEAVTFGSVGLEYIGTKGCSTSPLHYGHALKISDGARTCVCRQNPFQHWRCGPRGFVPRFLPSGRPFENNVRLPADAPYIPMSKDRSFTALFDNFAVQKRSRIGFIEKRKERYAMKPLHIHVGTPDCKPRTFRNCTGEPAKGVPVMGCFEQSELQPVMSGTREALSRPFACKKIAGGKKYAALVLAVSLWIAGQGPAAPSVAHAEIKSTISGGETKTIDNNQQSVTYNLNGSNITFTVTSTGKVYKVSSSLIYDAVTGNKVFIYGTVEGATFGGTSTNGAISNNTVTIDGGNVAGVNGAVATYGEAYENEVFFNNGTGSKGIDGGYSRYNTANNNEVTIGTSSASPTNAPSISAPTGSYIDQICGGKAGADANFNILTILNGTISNQHIYGGYGSSFNDMDGNAINNTVTIAGGTIKGNDIHIAGGCSLRNNADGNTVTVTGGTIESGPIYGGKGKVEANYNVVTISGGTFSHATPEIYGASATTANYNVVNLTGTTTGLDNASLTNHFTGSGTGNELHVGGTKTYGENGTPVIAGGTAWKGKDSANVQTNAVKSVSNFDTIALHNVAWSTDVPVLHATAGFSNNAGMTLDISGMAFDSVPAYGTMTLLSSGVTNNFSTLGLTYKSGATKTTATLNGTTPSQTIKAGTAKTSAANGVTLNYQEGVHTVSLAESYKKVNYSIENVVDSITLGNIVWNTNGTVRTLTAGAYNFSTANTINTSGLIFTNPEAVRDSMTLLSNATNLSAGGNIAHTQNFTHTLNGATLSATLSGNITRTVGEIGYTATGTTLNSVNLANWNGTTGSVPTGWTSTLGANSITAAGFDAPTIDAGTSKDILTTTTGNFFNDNQITGAMKYATTTSSDTKDGVTLTGSESKGVKASADGKSLVYERSDFNVSNIAFSEMTWGTARDASAAGYNYTNANVDLSKFMFKNPETISAGTTPLLKANDTLAEIAATEKNLSYTYSPVSGVRLDGIINGSYATTDAHALQYTATANKATKLTFGDVAWKDSGALMARPANITFAGADVDTTNINFTNIQSLEANKKMTLVSDFGDSVGTITGAKYKVGSTLEGEGKASLVGSDLIFTAETGTSQEQTHNTVMGAEVSMAALSMGNDFIGNATEGLSLASNIGADGVSSFANMGGGSIRQETGSHIDAHTWNAIIALGHQNKKERGTFEYGAFFEYGTGNYTTHNGDERGDGSTHYTGGGVLAKWTANHGMYVEGSLRAGTVHDDARNVLRDGNGVPYSYETNAPYFGGHLGVGKEISLANGNVVDVFGKYFYNRRNGVSFDAAGHYDLDAVTSQVLRIGARYTVKRSKWNFYAGAAYEHELDGKASGTADNVPIRGADTSGGSLRGELGVTVKPGENSPITLDFNVTGFAGKKQGFSGGVAVSLSF